MKQAQGKRESDAAAVVAAAEEAAGGQAQGQLAPGEVRLSTGVVVRVRPMSRDVYEDILSRFKEPEVPYWTNPEKGRTEENPSDPDYVRARRQYTAQVNRALKLAVYALAVDIVHVPEGADGPESPGWQERLRLSGLASGDSALAHVVDWLRFYAAKADEDSDELLRVAGRMIGVREADAQAALKSV